MCIRGYPEPVRILHVSDCYAPRTGGIESQVRDLARAQVRAGHEVHVLTATPGLHGEGGGVVEDDDGVQVHRLGTHMPFGLPVNPAAPPRMRALLREVAPDVVHVHAGVVSPFAYDGARVGRWRGAPAALSAVSAAAAERVRAVFGVPVGVLPNGMDLDQWVPDPAEVAAGSSVLRCVATMRLAPRKRGLALLGIIEDALTQLEPGQLTLEVLGDGPSRPAMARRVRRRGLSDVVTLRGRLSRDQVRAAYRHADVFIAPAVLAAFGIAALEARAAGLVVVARRGTGIEEFITDGLDGLLVDDDAGMARALARLVADGGFLESLRGHQPREGPSHACVVVDQQTVQPVGDELLDSGSAPGDHHQTGRASLKGRDAEVLPPGRGDEDVRVPVARSHLVAREPAAQGHHVRQAPPAHPPRHGGSAGAVAQDLQGQLSRLELGQRVLDDPEESEAALAWREPHRRNAAQRG